MYTLNSVLKELHYGLELPDHCRDSWLDLDVSIAAAVRTLRLFLLVQITGDILNIATSAGALHVLCLAEVVEYRLRIDPDSNRSHLALEAEQSPQVSRASPRTPCRRIGCVSRLTVTCEPTHDERYSRRTSHNFALERHGPECPYADADAHAVVLATD